MSTFEWPESPGLTTHLNNCAARAKCALKVISEVNMDTQALEGGQYGVDDVAC